jgi:thermostable 8-oxoguanine DNA glycosylase
MIDPTKITNFNSTDNELEEVLLFWVLVAGKNASTISKALEKILNSLKGSTPFEKIRGIEKNNLPSLLKNHGIGCYNNKAKALWELVNSNLNLRTCSVEDLEKIYGIGSKTARCFIVHSRPNSTHACLDTHVLKFLRAKGHKVPKGTPSSKKQYKELEQVFLNYVKESGKSVAEFDLEVWNSYANGGINYGR